MDLYKIFITLALLISLISLGLGVNSMIKFNGGEWICVTQKCPQENIITGEAWVNQNCKPTGPNNEMICEFKIDNDVFNVPLSGISNLSAMESCSQYVCDKQVYVRGT